MALDNRSLLLAQFLLGLVAWASVALVLVRPALARLDEPRALRWWLAPQLFRYIGMSLLATGITGAGMPSRFATWVATGDLITSLLAVAAFAALGRPGPLGRWLAIVATTVGLADLLHNLSLGMQLDAPAHLGSAWLVVAVIVPGMLVAHLGAIERLWRARRATRA